MPKRLLKTPEDWAHYRDWLEKNLPNNTGGYKHVRPRTYPAVAVVKHDVNNRWVSFEFVYQEDFQ